MSVRFTATANKYFYINSNLPALTAFTIALWAYISVDKDTYSAIFTIRGGSNPQVLTGGTGTAWELGSDAVESSSYDVNVGEWHHLCWVHRTDDDNELWIDGVNKVDGFTMVAPTPTALYLGTYDTTGAYSIDGRAACIKFWEAALSDSEVVSEVYSIVPRRLANIYGWWPLFPNTGERTRDYSGNGHDWTEGSEAAADEAGPPVSWGLWTPPRVVYVAEGSPQTVTLDALTLASTLPDSSISPGAVSLTMDALTLASSIPDISVSTIVSILLDTLTLAGSIPDLTIIVGTVVIILDTLTLTGSAVSLTVTVGAVSTLLDALTLASSVQDLSVVAGAVSILLDALFLAGSVLDLSVVTGAVLISLDALTLTGSIENLSVIAGAVAVILDTLTLASTVEDLTVTVGTIVTLSALTLAGSVIDLSIVAGAVSTLLDNLTLSSSLPDLTVTPGAVAITLDDLTLTSSVEVLAVVATVAIVLDALTLASSLEDLTVVPGAVSIILDDLTLASLIPDLSVVVVGGVNEAMFKAMWRGLFKRMQ